MHLFKLKVFKKNDIPTHMKVALFNAMHYTLYNVFDKFKTRVNNYDRSLLVLIV